jgi:hypothetical protein
MSENEPESDSAALLGGEGLMLMTMLIQNALGVAEAVEHLEGSGINTGPAGQLFNRLIGAANSIAGEVLDPLTPAPAKSATMRVFPKNGGD